MKTTFLRMAVCLALFTACNDKDSSKPGDDTSDDGGDGTKTGKLQNGTINGMHYATATQSGVTGTDGTFKYADGETVTFNLGGIAFGSATAKDNVTLFDLFDVTPLNDPASLIDLLTDATTVSAETRMLNAAIVIQALDADANPLNGVDLAGRDTALADATIAFDWSVRTFVHEELPRIAARIPNVAVGYAGLTYVYTVDAAIAYVFDSAGIDASGDGLVRIGQTDNGETSESSHYDVTLDNHSYATQFQGFSGDTLSLSLAITRDNGGRLTAFDYDDQGFTFAYNVHGQLTLVTAHSASTSQDQLGASYTVDGRLAAFSVPASAPAALSYSVDSAARTVTSVTGFTTTTWTYDTKGHITKTVEVPADSASPGDSVTTTASYGDSGLMQTVKEDVSDGAVATRTTATYAYTATGKLQSVTTVTDDLSADSHTQSLTSYTYDTKDRLTAKVDTAATLDSSGTVVGSPTEVARIEQTFDASDKLRTHADSTSGTLLTTTYGYDAAGNLVSSTTNNGTTNTLVSTYGLAPTHNRFVAYLQQLGLSLGFAAD